MAIKVNNTATSRDGLIIPSGYLIGFDFTIPDGSKKLHYSPKVYVSEEARTEGKAQVYPDFISSLSYVYEPTLEEFGTLNPAAVNDFYNTYLKTLTEIGVNTEVVL